LVGDVSFPLTLTLSRREREERSGVILKSRVAIRPAVLVGYVSFPLTLALPQGEGKSILCLP